ncbi:DUF2149 domain-containing protein [Pseudomaricurvus sp. HS19]|uniref:DUF2149 domain-containing protein n=1 Tax=Pseudomaricurvus sp. HS19 TaxID=2692626 RepID=UPI001369F7AE|nr:DUF2149 domain-containing protein [Pseudomaricurvus sp. HS19]MYM64888.1 DUF2149 domain-containing protein [Pseudomaricurvus sp. HS19]
MNRPNGSPRWHHNHFSDADNDPLSGFANIMDVMLVFALGLLIALLSQSEQLRQHFNLEKEVVVQAGEELVEMPEGMESAMQTGPEGMESLGKVYRDPQTGKLILINQ